MPLINTNDCHERHTIVSSGHGLAILHYLSFKNKVNSSTHDLRTNDIHRQQQ